MVKKLKYIFIVLGILWIVIFIINLDFSDYKSEDFIFSSQINKTITENSLHRGFIKLDKGLLLSQNCPEYTQNKEKTNKTIGMIDPPYELKKKPNDSIFLVLKKNDSFYFSMIDYSKSRVKEPTFWQLLKTLLQE